MGVRNIPNSIRGVWPNSTLFTKYFIKITARSLENENEFLFQKCPQNSQFKLSSVYAWPMVPKVDKEHQTECFPG